MCYEKNIKFFNEILVIINLEIFEAVKQYKLLSRLKFMCL